MESMFMETHDWDVRVQLDNLSPVDYGTTGTCKHWLTITTDSGYGQSIDEYIKVTHNCEDVHDSLLDNCTDMCLVIGGVLLVCAVLMCVICANIMCGKKKPAAATQQQLQSQAIDPQQPQAQYVPQQQQPQAYIPPQMAATPTPMFCASCGMRGPFSGTFCNGCGSQI